MLVASFIGSCLAFVAASLFLWKRPMGQRGILPAWALLLFAAGEIGSAVFHWIDYVQGLRMAFSAFRDVGLGYFMLIFGGLAAVIIWVFDRW